MVRGSRLLLGVALVAGPLARSAVVDRPAPAAKASANVSSSSVLPAEAVQQLAERRAAKAARSVGERKLATVLLATGPARAATASADDRGLAVLVDVTATVDGALLERVEALGGRIVAAYPTMDALRVELPRVALADLSALTQVRSVKPPRSRRSRRAGRSGQRARSRTPLRRRAPPSASMARGVKVGVISDGVDGLAASVTSADLPADVTVLPGLAGTGSEGRAMLEIIHDLAPGAQLFFATAQGGQAALAQAILALPAAGCTVIVDDVQYATEPAFQDGVVAVAVNTVVAAGVNYLAAAGNSGNLDAGTSATWEGDFVDGGAIGSAGARIHDFDPTGVTNRFERLSGAARKVLTLQWVDPYGHSANDYDIYAFNSANTLVGGSDIVQDGNDDPVEAFVVPPDAAYVAIVRDVGEARLLRVHMSGGRLVDFVTAGAAYGHNAAASTLSVGATPAAGGLPSGPSGPHPNPFTTANVVEPFSSDGPRRVFFTPLGAPLTPGNLTATGGVVIAKPDITAADGVTTSVSGFAPFFGTSAAAPHAAALAALMRAARPTATGAQIAATLRASTIDIGSAGADRDAGAGIVMAQVALQAAVVLPLLPPVPPPPGPDMVPVVPTRILETRAAAGQVGYAGPRPAAGQTLELVVTGGASQVPADAIAVALNVTATEATAAGVVTVWPCGTPRPTASNLNLAPADTRPNLAITKVGPGGKVCLFTQVATELLADVAGYAPAGSRYVPVVPERLLDTRPGAGQIGYTGAKPGVARPSSCR